MWKARKIELVKNRADLLYFSKCFSLEINGVLICNNIGSDLKIHSPSYFQVLVCSDCGFEGCNPGGMLSIVRHEKSLLIIPCFDCMESNLEFDSSAEDYGERECPPHEWYEQGILEIDEFILPKFLDVLSGFDMNEIPLITYEKMNSVLEWEMLVKQKPLIGFMRQ